MRRIPLLAFLGLGACAADIEGPQPELAEPGPAAVDPVSPGVVCRDQRTTTVEITGHGFSPLPYDLARDPRAWLPTVTLTRAAGLDGTPGDGLGVTWDGRPEPLRPNADALVWRSQDALAIEIRPAMTRADGTSARCRRASST